MNENGKHLDKTDAKSAIYAAKLEKKIRKLTIFIY